MRTINKITELKINLKTFQDYNTNKDVINIKAVEKLIAGGKCFVSYKIQNEYRFVPSRFVGYYNNNLEKHSKNVKKDGRETNPAINKLAINKLSINDTIEKKYLEYCNAIKIIPHNKKRKYWVFEFDNE